MNISHTRPQLGIQRPSLQPRTESSESLAEDFTFGSSDKFDFTEPSHLVKEAAIFVGGALPITGVMLNGPLVADADTKAQRWSSFAAASASFVAVPLLLAGIGSGHTGAMAAGSLLTAVAGGNAVYQDIKG